MGMYFAVVLAPDTKVAVAGAAPLAAVAAAQQVVVAYTQGVATS